MPIPTTVADLSTTPSSNYPAGSEGVGVTDDYIRAHASIIKQVSNAKVSAGAITGSGLTASANNVLLGRVTSGSGAIEEIVCSAAGRALLDDADAAAQRTTLGLTSATQAEMEAGTETNIRVMTPQGVKQAIDALGKAIKVSGYQSTTSGTSVNFTSIPASVKRITVIFKGVSIDSNQVMLLRIGDGAIATTGYAGVASVQSGTTANSTAGFPIVTATNINSSSLNGTIVLTALDSTTWVASGVLSDSVNFNTFVSSGTKTLAGTLDRLSIVPAVGGVNFDAGTMNVFYEYGA